MKKLLLCCFLLFPSIALGSSIETIKTNYCRVTIDSVDKECFNLVKMKRNDNNTVTLLFTLPDDKIKKGYIMFDITSTVITKNENEVLFDVRAFKLVEPTNNSYKISEAKRVSGECAISTLKQVVGCFIVVDGVEIAVANKW